MNFPTLISGPKINDRKKLFGSKVERNGMTIYGMIFNLFDNGEVQPSYRCKNKKKLTWVYINWNFFPRIPLFNHFLLNHRSVQVTSI